MAKSFWFCIRLALVGWPKYKTLDEWILNCETVQDGLDYARDHWRGTWERDITPEDDWQEPHKAFLSIQSSGTPSDCDEVVSAKWAFLLAKDCQAFPLYIRRPTGIKENPYEAHAILAYKLPGDDINWYWTDNTFPPMVRYSSVQACIKARWHNCDYARYVKWDDKLKKFKYAEIIPI